MPVPNACFSVLFIDKKYINVSDPYESIDMGLPEEFTDSFVIRGQWVDSSIYIKGLDDPVRLKLFLSNELDKRFDS